MFFSGGFFDSCALLSLPFIRPFGVMSALLGACGALLCFGGAQLDALAAPDPASAAACAALTAQLPTLAAWRRTMARRPNLQAYLESPRRRK
jgi:hypothetical protein